MSTVSKKSLGKLYIEKKTPHEWLVFLLFILPFTFGTLTGIFHIPDAIKFSLDVILVFLSIIVFHNRFMLVKKDLKPLIISVLVFLTYTALTYCFNYQSPFYFIWGARNTFRFYVAFFIFSIFTSEEWAEKLFKLLDIVFWINFFVSIIQFVLLGVKQDYLGGIFGTMGGTNGYTLIFLCIIVSRSLLLTFNAQEKTLICVLKITASLLVAAMAEMKFYYIAFIIILAITSVLTKISRKKIILLIISIIGILLGSVLLSVLFDEFENFISLKNIWDAATKENYASQKDINRLSAIITLSKNYVTTIHEQLFGLGLGNCDTSSISIFNSKFYQTHSFLHYTWFSSAMLFLENGIFGLIMYFSFFFICGFSAFKKIREKTGNLIFCQMAIVMAVMCCIFTVYNSSLRIDSAYMAYFVLALPFMSSVSS